METTFDAWDERAKVAFMSATRQEMYSALELFHKHVQHSISLIFAVTTGVAVAIGFVASNAEMARPFMVLLKYAGAIILVIALPLFGAVATRIISRHYGLYVAALVYAADVHRAAGVDGHVWFREIQRYREALGEDCTTEALVKARQTGRKHTWYLYAMLIRGLVVLAAIGGLALLFGL